ncbi:MAG: dihydroorotate dehydrogenase electron transfer subunit [Candidatus Woesearchaeota archaeon]
MRLEQPLMMKVDRVVDEAKDQKTFVFRHRLDAMPGQFVMIWLARINLKPFSISYNDGERFAVTVLDIGSFTNKMMGLKKGSLVGLQGPYGNGFELKGTRVALVGGGVGAAPLAYLADELALKKKAAVFFVGARTDEFLLYKSRFPKAVFATDDGSFGNNGFVTELLEKSANQFDYVYGCGPEPMLKRLAEICDTRKIPYQLSLERYMKCGIGVCGSCCIDPLGLRVCAEGPVFDEKIIRQLSEIGKYKRSESGKVGVIGNEH